MSVPSEVAPSSNGHLVNRVQQLRLHKQVGAGRASSGSWLPWVLCGLMALTWAGVGVRWYKQNGKEADPAATAPAVRTSTAAAPAVVAPGEIVFNLKGNLIPSLQIAVSPVDVGGQVIEINFKEGDSVAKNAVLARIEDRKFKNEFHSAKAAFEASELRYRDHLPGAVRREEKEEMLAQLDEAEANRLQAQQDLTRVRTQRASGSNSPQDVEKAEATLKMAAARLERLKKTDALLLAGSRVERRDAAKADMVSAKAKMEEAQRMLDNCVIRAPIGGTVLTKKSDLGSVVNPMSFNVAASLCEIADLSKLEVEVDVPERQIAKVRENLDCTIVTDADESRVYRGYVDRIMPIADDSKNVVKVRVRVILPKGETAGSFLKPKMSATVTAFNRPFTMQANDQPWE